MQLKALHMLGFKSFADKTTVVFQPGVTAVVGPNGCGKSNISDAIRWVLGEQSARHLRGEKMEDVIFNGTESRKPLGMAEVSLTLKDVAGALSSEFGQYSEIEITRRLFRSGESEYFINKIPCRLKDIRDLMMDAGVGAKIHAIIEQDRGPILSSADGSSVRGSRGRAKNKARRQESWASSSPPQNQVRVNDILTEVKRQVNSLDRQARKAERYQKLRAELKFPRRLRSGLGCFEWQARERAHRTARPSVKVNPPSRARGPRPCPRNGSSPGSSTGSMRSKVPSAAPNTASKCPRPR
jgi:chromosome segregation protein